jgi:hypothetical protein
MVDIPDVAVFSGWIIQVPLHGSSCMISYQVPCFAVHVSNSSVAVSLFMCGNNCHVSKFDFK